MNNFCNKEICGYYDDINESCLIHLYCIDALIEKNQSLKEILDSYKYCIDTLIEENKSLKERLDLLMSCNKQLVQTNLELTTKVKELELKNISLTINIDKEICHQGKNIGEPPF